MNTSLIYSSIVEQHGNISSGNITIHRSGDRDEVTSYFNVDFCFYMDKYIISSIATIGILGNLLNLAILTRRQFQQSLSKLEKSAHLGLISLAISDLFVCICLFPKIFHPDKYRKPFIFYEEKNYWFYWRLYSEAAANTFIVWSTWLTVCMAISRYVALCHPMRARTLVGPSSTKASILTTFTLSVIINLPYFWIYETKTFFTHYYIGMSSFGESFGYMLIRWFQSLLGTFMPIAILIVCNVSLAKTLQKSAAMRRQCTRQAAPSDEKRHRITLTLVVIILMYLICVAPSRLMEFVIDEAIARMGNSSYLGDTASIDVAVSILNLAVSFNFAMNFILYCVVNSYFRKTLRNLMVALLPCLEFGGSPGSRRSSISLSRRISTFRLTSVETWT